MRGGRLLLAAAALAVVAAPADGQFRRRGGRRAVPDYEGANVEYTGKFTFVRLRYSEGFGGWSGGQPGWAHDYPRAERNLAKILREISYVDARGDASNILALDDPALFRFPLAYLSEPGYWTMEEPEVRALRSYLLKGGFLIVDDFVGDQWFNFEQQMARVFPDLDLVQLDATHPIFNAFFHIPSLDFTHPNYPWAQPVFFGVFEDNDPSKRLMVVVNYNNDIGDYWEWSDQGWLPIDLSNEAYKLGVNYLIYAMTR